jgi:hypothetical protein
MPAGPSEFNRIFKSLAKRKAENRNFRPIKWSQNDQILLREEITHSGQSFAVTLEALSPSDEMLTLAAADIAKSFSNATSKTIAKLIPSRPNHVSVAMTLTVGSRSILLGSDLEQTTSEFTGWSAVCSSKTRSQGKSQIYKVAHHGSESGFNEQIWLSMLSENPMMLLTPFRAGRHKLPTPDHQRRLLGMAEDAYITASPDASRTPRKRSPKIEAVINASTRERRLSMGPVGHIRWRAPIHDPSDNGTVELFDGAYKI